MKVTSATTEFGVWLTPALRRFTWSFCLLCLFVCQGCESSKEDTDSLANTAPGHEDAGAADAASDRSGNHRGAASAGLREQPGAVYPDARHSGLSGEMVKDLRQQLDTTTEGVSRNHSVLRALRSRVDEVLAGLQAAEVRLDSLTEQTARDIASLGTQASVIQEHSADLLLTRRDLGTALQHLEDLDRAIGAHGDTIDSNNQAITTLSARQEAEAKRLDPIARQLDLLGRQLKRDLERVALQGSQIEMNSVRLFETLMTLDSIEQELARVQEAQESAKRRAAEAESAGSEKSPGVSQLIPLMAVVLCLLVPLAVVLSPAEPGARKAESQDARGRAAWTLTAWFGGGAAYCLVGIGVMFGSSLGGILGTPTQYLSDVLRASPADLQPAFLNLLLLQLSLAAVVSVVVCSVIPSRIPSWACLLVALPVGGLVYPLFGHWIAVSSATSEHDGWLTGLGFINQAAGPEVALLAGATALFLARGLSVVTAGASPANSASHERDEASVFSAMLLWLGWLGVIGAASAGRLGSPSLLLGLAAGSSGAAFSVLILGAVLSFNRQWLGILPFSILAGVVAASGGPPTATLAELFLLGALAGVSAHLLIWKLSDRFRSSTTLAAALLSGGLLGTLAPALVGATGFVSTLSFAFVIPQLQGIGAALLLAFIAGQTFAWSISRTTRWGAPA